MENQEIKEAPIQTEKNNLDKQSLAKKIDAISWALFFIMIGCLGLLPEGTIPGGTWLLGTAIIIFGSTIIHHYNGLKISGFWIIMGIIALGTGLSDILGVNIPVFPILIIIIGASIIVKPLLDKKQA